MIVLALFDQYAWMFQSWQIVRYEQEGNTYLLQVEATLIDNSKLSLKDYVFQGNRRKYAYQWMEPDGRLRRRWDNAPHWPEIDTAPHHLHIPGIDQPQPSTITNLEDLFAFLAESLQ